MAKVNVVAIVAVVDMKTCNLGVHAGHDQQILARTSYILRTPWSAGLPKLHKEYVGSISAAMLSPSFPHYVRKERPTRLTNGPFFKKSHALS